MSIWFNLAVLRSLPTWQRWQVSKPSTPCGAPIQVRFTSTVDRGWQPGLGWSLLGGSSHWIWLVVWLPCFIFPEILGISSSQLTKSYFSEGWPWPTNQEWLVTGVSSPTFFERDNPILKGDKLDQLLSWMILQALWIIPSFPIWRISMKILLLFLGRNWLFWASQTQEALFRHRLQKDDETENSWVVSIQDKIGYKWFQWNSMDTTQFGSHHPSQCS